MMSMQSKRELLLCTFDRYRTADRAQKGRILDELIAATGYHRKYAMALLKHPPPLHTKPAKRVRKKTYPKDVDAALVKLWEASNYLCSKRLAPFLATLIEALERSGELCLGEGTKRRLCAISASTIDRRLRSHRRQKRLRGLSTTKPGTLLRNQIPLRTYADWSDAEQKPGFMEIDLVAHCGESTHGEYLHSLVLTDVYTGWTVCASLLNRSQEAVNRAIREVRAQLPFPLLGLDSDNGSEFINHNLYHYCKREQITFTRCRPYKKNDQCHVEQKNFTIVRQMVGYERYEGSQAQQALAQLYRPLRLYVNFFQPSLKIVKKERNGAKVKKTYDRAQTPYQRLVASGILTTGDLDELSAYFRHQNPVDLLKRIERAQDDLWSLPKVRISTEATNAPK